MLMAPGRSVLGFSIESLAAIERPMKIVVGGADAIAPKDQCSVWLHERVAGSSLATLPEAGHYVFLPEPTRLGKLEAPDIFSEQPGVNRRAVHQEVALAASRFFGQA